MTAWAQWVHRPQSHWLRRAIFQVHLWAGIGLGVYILVVCISGSAAVFNSELYSAFLPKPKHVAISGTRMGRPQLLAAAHSAFPTAAIGRIIDYREPSEAVIVTLGAGVNADQRFLDPYTGRDLGNARPFGLRMVSYISQLHMNLMLGYAGRLMNGLGGFLTAALSLTGMVIWWPGIHRWRRNLTIDFDARPRRLNWDLHNSVGFWSFTIVFMWALTGGYLVYPKPFEKILSFFARHNLNLNPALHDIHVGNFAGWPVKALWVVLGLTPPLLFVTGLLMWWNRVVRPWLARRPALPAAPASAPSEAYSRVIVEP